MRTHPFPIRFALTAVMIASLAACGGSDDDGGDNSGPTDKLTLTGSVVADQPVANAAVCLDLNANSACDAGEPTGQTDAKGAYTLEATKEQSAASLIALMTKETGAAAPYVLRQVPGKSGQINPLTTLVATGVKAGMTEASARSNTAIQLGIADAKIDNFQDDPGANPARMQDNARTMARVVIAALEKGGVLEVGDQSAARAAEAGDLFQLRYAAPDDYYVRVGANDVKAAGSTTTTYHDVRSAVDKGQPVTDSLQLYAGVFLTPTGWKRCDETTAHRTTIGNPNRGVFCDVNASVSYVVASDIAGKPMAEVITAIHANSATSTLNYLTGMSAKPLLDRVGNASFPAGATTRQRVSAALNTYYFIDDWRRDIYGAATYGTTLDELIDNMSASKVKLPDPKGSLTLGVGASAQRNVRVAFTGKTSATAGTVQFYDCALSASDVASGCAATQTGTYAIETIHGVRILSFAGHPATTANRQITYYGEITTSAAGKRVARVRQAKPDTAYAVSVAQRLNPTAWAALKAPLGL